MTTNATALATTRLDGRTALITGSTSGIGAAIADTLAAAGAHVVVSGRNPTRGAEVTARIKDSGGRADFLAVNIRAPHVLAASILPAMADAGGGVVINVGSWMASVGSPFAALYTATKAAIEQLTRSWAAEFGAQGVRVNTVSPGVTLTPGNEAARTVLDAMTATTPAGVVVQPQDVAQGVLFLASDTTRMIHGSILSIDGGISSTRSA